MTMIAAARSAEISDVFAWNEADEHCLRHPTFTAAVRDLNADFTPEEIVGAWVVEEHATGFDTEGDPFTRVRKWTPRIEESRIFGPTLAWQTEGWR